MSPAATSRLNARSLLLTSMAMVAFAGNSLLCRAALKDTGIDAGSFTSLRLVAGAVTLYLLLKVRKKPHVGGNWLSALALFAYAAGFSFAYIGLPAGVGALILFGAVQATMIGHGLWRGERLSGFQSLGLVLAVGGLLALLLPGLSAPPLFESFLMLSAGVAWGIYSLRGKGTGDPTAATAGNFIRAVPITLAMSVVLLKSASFDLAGSTYAITSGALASGLGYAIWYAALPALKSTKAATVQLSVPVIATLGGIAFLGEPVTLRFMLVSAAILGGISLVMVEKSKK